METFLISTAIMTLVAAAYFGTRAFFVFRK